MADQLTGDEWVILDWLAEHWGGLWEDVQLYAHRTRGKGDRAYYARGARKAIRYAGIDAIVRRPRFALNWGLRTSQSPRDLLPPTLRQMFDRQRVPTPFGLKIQPPELVLYHGGGLREPLRRVEGPTKARAEYEGANIAIPMDDAAVDSVKAGPFYCQWAEVFDVEQPWRLEWS